jgi:catechol 2,3-dioxygenase-like lactoylglutathione lyase family enzyme
VIIGAHILVFTPAVEPTRDFLRDALQLSAVDAGGGWLIFALPPAEVAVHPAEQSRHELYLMCDDLAATIARLSEAGATFGLVREERWGRIAVMTMPGGAQLPIYQPSHQSPILGEGQASQPDF